ncbi:DALR anticodon-binding domain-containing protein 3-like [Ptychodera flava]|uniref:DALR anticodon-binding domain-containing protein 3-like n=1 Tax=Ptychodera flava TaxID=63121 RepID=UPI00396A858C
MAAPCVADDVYLDIFEHFHREFEEFTRLRNQGRRNANERKILFLHKSTKGFGSGDFKIPSASLKEALTSPPPRSSLEPSTTNSEDLDSLCEELVKSSQSWTLEVSTTLVSETAIYLKLHRGKTFKKVLGRVIKDGSQYGRVSSRSHRSYLINNCCFLNLGKNSKIDRLTLASLRALFLCEHTGCLLAANGFDVIHAPNIPPGELKAKVAAFEISLSGEKSCEQRDIDRVQTDGTEKVKNSKYMYCESRTDLDGKQGSQFSCPTSDSSNDSTIVVADSDSTTDMSYKDGAFLHIRQFLIDAGKSIGKNGYDQNIQNVQVLGVDGNATKVLQNSARLHCYVTDAGTKLSQPVHVLHIVNYERAFVQQQVDIVRQTLFGEETENCQNSHLVYGPVLARKTGAASPLMDALEFLQLRKTQMREAWVMKYGKAVSGEGWENTITAMTLAAIKFELLSTTARNPVKVDLSQTGTSVGKTDCRIGSFVIYNYARLSTLFAHYKEASKQGVYPDLPDVADVDFTLLREEEEWQLLLHYILPYPSLVKETIAGPGGQHEPSSSPHAKIQTHRICNFLVNLSQDFSSYYGRVHVLTEARAHLLPTIFARLYLLKCVQQVMKNALRLLNITPLEQV